MLYSGKRASLLLFLMLRFDRHTGAKGSDIRVSFIRGSVYVDRVTAILGNHHP